MQVKKIAHGLPVRGDLFDTKVCRIKKEKGINRISWVSHISALNSSIVLDKNSVRGKCVKLWKYQMQPQNLVLKAETLICIGSGRG